MGIPRIGSAFAALLAILSLVSPLDAFAQSKTVAIATLMSHPALDDVQAGLKEELARRGWKEGQNLKFIERNANQQMQLLATIASDIAGRSPDVSVAITTPMAQSMARAISGPLVFAAVTDPVGAGLVPDLEHGHGLISGTSDAWPYKAQLALIREMLPKAKTIGVLYNPGEAASQYGLVQIRRDAPEFGFTLIEAGVSSVAEVRPVSENLAGRVDALFLSSDNTVIGGMVGALSVAIERHVPLFVGDSGTVARGGLAAVSVGYRELGHRTGELVDRFLRGERDIPTIVSQGEETYVNLRAAELMRVTIPATVIQRSTKVYKDIAR